MARKGHKKGHKKTGKPKVPPSASARTQPWQGRTRANVSEPGQQIRVEEALRAWRLSEAKQRNVPPKLCIA